MYYLFKNKKVDKFSEDIIKVNKINEDEIIKVDEVNEEIKLNEDTEIKEIKLIEDTEIKEIKNDVTMPSLPIRLRKPIRKNQPKSFALSIFSYKIIDGTVNNALTLGIGVGLGIGLSVGLCLGALISISLTSSSK